ncbi:MAG: delta(1)-pyrroline-2-carboxylate reductase family protein [Steroidobacteraceae bacterium]
MSMLSAAETAALLPYAPMVAALRAAALEAAAGKIACPQRQVLPMGEGGALLSMVAVGADIGVHKLVTVVTENRSRALPTIQGQVSVVRASTGELLLALDGATVTGRRTAALSMLGVATLAAGPPRCVLLYGTGTQSLHHVEALAALYPGIRVAVIGRAPGSAEAFCEANAATLTALSPASADDIPTDTDLVITCTTSPEPVYRAGAREGRLVIAVGAYTPLCAEIDTATVGGSVVYVDDPANARHEAGDLIRAQVDWTQVRSIADALGAHKPGADAVLFKTVGSAAWDLAAARVAVSTVAAAQRGVTNLS